MTVAHPPHRTDQPKPMGLYWTLLAVVLLAFVLRIPGLAQEELWFDESVSFTIASKGWGDIIIYSQNNPFEHPPLYYLVLKSWMQLAGTSEFALRFFSVIWGILLVPLLYRFIAPWGGRRAALLAALLAAVSVLHIAHSKDARMYTLVPFLGVLSLLCFFRALTNQHRRWWIAYLLVVSLGAATHYYFMLLQLVPLVFLLLGKPRYRRLLPVFLALSLITMLLTASWFWLSPGPRQSIQENIQNNNGGASSFVLRVQHTVSSLLLQEPAAGHLLVMGGLSLLGIAFWSLPPPPRTHPVSSVGSRRFLLAWLLVPWLAALAIPYWLQGRHLAYLWPALYSVTACGLVALRAKGTWLLVVGLLLVGLVTGYGLHLDGRESNNQFEFGRIMAFIEDRALPDDLVIMNQPAMSTFVEYYARRDLTAAYVSAKPHVATEDKVEQQLQSLTAQRSRFWLGPVGAWTADPDSLVEQWLGTHTFQAYKEWFPGSGSAALYFAPEPLESLPMEPVDWKEGFHLERVRSSSLVVSPNDAVRLLLHWKTAWPVDSSYALTLHLADDTGTIWASRWSKPCAGWCPTDTWQPGATVRDRHALLIPAGTPPGVYRLQLAWSLSEGGRELVTVDGRSRIDLGTVQVIREKQTEGEANPQHVVQYPLQAEFDKRIALLGFNLAQTKVNIGEAVVLELQWLALSSRLDDCRLRLELVGPEGEVPTTWDRPPVASFIPSSDWQAGDLLRAPLQLGLPSDVHPGAYQLRLKLLDATGQPLQLSGSRSRQALGGLIRWQDPLTEDGLDLVSLQIADRSRSFDLPTIAHPLDFQLGKKVELLGYDLGSTEATAGEQVELTLYWRGRGATIKPYKVFTHIGDGQQAPLAQHDGPPGEGCCPTNSWQIGEVVEDRHIIPLPIEMPAGTYQLIVGMYDEDQRQRLKVVDAQGHELDNQQIPITKFVVHPGSTPTPSWPERPYRLYLPVVQADG